MTVPIDGAPPAAAALILELAHGAAFTHIVGTMAQLEIADQLAGGARGVADLAGAVPRCWTACCGPRPCWAWSSGRRTGPWR